MKDEETPAGGDGGFTRRDFLKGGAAGALTTGLVGGGLLAAQPTAEATIVGPGPVPVRVTVNGSPRDLKLEPRVTLLEALRDHLDLTGAKRVCDRGTCGACTVLLDGRPVYACSVLAVEADGRAIQTVEGIGSTRALHPLQAAFVEHDAMQCGFCTPGFIMAAKALIERHPDADPESIVRGLGGNLCRCGAYAGIRRAVLEAALRGRQEGRGGGSHA